LIHGATLTVTDLDNALTLDLTSALTSPDHSFTVPVDSLLKAMAGMDCTEIHAEELTRPTEADPEGFMRWTIGDMQIDLPCLPPADFPTMRDMNTEHSLTLKAENLRDMLKACLHSVSSEETRYYLRGVNFCGEYAGPDQLPMFTAVSTDGHRLTHVSVPGEKWAGEAVLVPTDTVQSLIPLMSNPDAPVHIATNNRTQVHFTGINWKLRAKVIDGTFPDYTRVMPKDSAMKGHSVVDCDEIKTKAKRIVALSDSRACATEVNAEDGTLTHHGDSVKTIKIKTNFDQIGAAQCPTYGVNAKYLAAAMDVLRIFGSKAVIAAEDAANPHRMTPMVQPPYMDVTVVCMPIRV
jgi:DNA polymerase III subunit beta